MDDQSLVLNCGTFCLVFKHQSVTFSGFHCSLPVCPFVLSYPCTPSLPFQKSIPAQRASIASQCCSHFGPPSLLIFEGGLQSTQTHRLINRDPDIASPMAPAWAKNKKLNFYTENSRCKGKVYLEKLKPGSSMARHGRLNGMDCGL